MREFGDTVLTAVVAFASTNIDDIFVLMLFYGQLSPTFRRRHVVAGQYLGFLALVAISTLGSPGAQRLRNHRQVCGPEGRKPAYGTKERSFTLPKA
ncbi:MAG TPA: hypothetical protein VFS21_11145 [Roseiflexaceae bacterium]|nr:hypothetical protein [Roseiflexaceae bacterium]